MDAVAAKNASNWLRLAFHALTCPDGQACPIKELCVVGKSVLKQICLAEQDISTPTRPTSSVRKLLLHWLRCEDHAGCPLCSDVWRELSSPAAAAVAITAAAAGSGGGNNFGGVAAVEPAAAAAAAAVPPRDQQPQQPADPQQQGHQHRESHDVRWHRGTSAVAAGSTESSGSMMDEERQEEEEREVAGAAAAAVTVFGGGDGNGNGGSSTTSGGGGGGGAAAAADGDATAGAPLNFASGLYQPLQGSHSPNSQQAYQQLQPPQQQQKLQLQLREAAGYLRYLLHCLVVRSLTPNEPHRQLGRRFWQDILMPPPPTPPLEAAAAIAADGTGAGAQEQHKQQGAPLEKRAVVAAMVAGAGGGKDNSMSGGGRGGGGGGSNTAALAAATAGPSQRHLGSRQLLVHRLSCADGGCAVCSHTCELFRRGLAVQPEHFPPAPAPQLVEGGALDALVEELSRSVALINL